MIKLKEVTMKYDSKIILNHLNYEFELGQIHVIMGQSGCGKTTLLRIMSGLQKPTSGKVFLNNIEIKKPSKLVFMMHQHYTNFEWKTCLENILFPLSIENKITNKDIIEAKKILNLVGLSNYESKYPSQLSGGMNQRLAFARTIMLKPNIILMDEPMSALDKITRKKMQNLLKNLQKETNNTIIMVTHSEEEGKYMADKLMNFGGLN